MEAGMPKEKRARTRTLYVPLDTSACTELIADAEKNKRAMGQQAAFILEWYYQNRGAAKVIEAKEA
jgi:hypothetical protein